MIVYVVALLMLGAGLFGLVILFRDLRAGHARFLFSGGVHWLECDRRDGLPKFLAISLVNVVVVCAALVIGVVLILGLIDG